LGWLSEALEAAPGAPAEIRAHGLMWAGTMLLHTGEHDRAAELLEAALLLFRELKDAPWTASTLERLAVALAAIGAPAEARERLDESLALFRKQDDPRGVSAVLRRLAELEWDEGDHAASVSLTQEALGLSRAGQDAYWTAELLTDLGERLLVLGDLARSVDAAREGASLAYELGSVPTVARGLTALAEAATQARDVERASRLWATVEALEQRGDGTFGSEARGRHRRTVASLPEGELTAARAAVRTLSLAELVAQALA
jgi:tetratricopeptide (TPR) repeat protein